MKIDLKMYLPLLLFFTFLCAPAFACDPNCFCSGGYVVCAETVRRLDRIPKNIPQSTYQLIIDNHIMTSLSSLDCSRIPGLNILSVKNNFINNLKTDDFYGCSMMNTLYLDNNQIKSIYSDTFAGTRLTYLSLNGNMISDLNFTGSLPVMLNTLSLENNHICVIDDNAFKVMDLRVLSLKNNHITTVADTAFVKLAMLNDLNMAGNILFENLNFTGSLSMSLQTFNMDRNMLLDFNFTETIPNSIVTLYVRNNAVGYIAPGMFRNLYNLQTLYLDGNLLSDIAFVQMLPYSLGYLSLQNNSLTVTDLLNGTFHNLNQLKTLHLDSNQLSGLDFLPMLPSSLQYLSLQNNSLTEILNVTFENLNQLTDLYLDGNCLSDLAFVSMLPTSLRILSLNNNSLTEIPNGTFSNCNRNLQHLYLEGNSISRIENKAFPETMNYFNLYLSRNSMSNVQGNVFPYGLQEINLAGNSISQINVEVFPETVYHLYLSFNLLNKLRSNISSSYMYTIWMDNNAFTEIGNETFKNFRRLIDLNLERNMIAFIENGAFDDNPNLYHLNLKGNMITLIESNVFKNTINLQRILFKENPVSCQFSVMKWSEWVTSGYDISSSKRSFIVTPDSIYYYYYWYLNKDMIYILSFNDCPGIFADTTTELSTQTTTSSSGPTTPPPCTGVGNRTNKVLGESCGQHGVDGICIVAFSACMQSSSDTGWKCRCAQGYAQTSTSCVSRPNVLFSSQEPYKWIIPTSKTSNVTLNLTAVDGFQTSNPTASLTGEGASYFTVTASRTNVILSVTRSPDKSNYTLVLTASVTIDEIVIREFKEIIISVSQSLITKDIIILDGTPKGSVVGELCKFCSTGSDLCSISSTNIPIIINEEGIIETTNLINLNVIQNIQTVAYSTIIQVTKRTGLIANLTIFVVRTRYTTTLPEDSTLQTQVGRMNLVQLFRILPNENLIVDGDSIKLTRQLNYEVEPYFEKIFTLAVNGTTSHEFDILLTIRVQDVNDNAPSFSAPTYTFKAVKSAYKDIVVGVTTAIDADSNSQLKYVVSPNNILSIDNYGVIKIAEPISQTNYMATVTVSDGFFTTNSSISVEFYQHINVNLNRTFNASVPENTVVQNIISVLDINYENYQFTDQSANKDFVIDQIMGTIRNTRMFDRENEQERQFKYTITATKKNEASCSLVIIGEITIRVTDVNDEPPVFVNTPYNASVQEEQAGKQLMMNFPISTTDKDLNSVVSYSVLSPSNFTINSTTGVISTSLAIDRETTSSILVKIIANDTVNSATASVTVIVLDINDNPPYFTAIAYNYSIPEDYGIGNTVGIVTANDRDSGKNAEITFALKSDGEFFMINQTTGRITVAKELDRETTEIHLLTVYARDNGDQIKSASTTATITLTDVNDNSPRFESNRITVTFDEDKSCSSPILTVVATDADKSNTPNSQIKYSIISGGENFLLGEQTGILRCINTLDYEKNSTFILLIKAEDNGANKLSSNQTVGINVNDINDNPPEFINPKAELIIRYYSQVSRVVEKFDVIDKDTGENGRLTMTLGGDAANFLVIDKDGLLRTKAQSNPSNILYSLTIIANDNGVPPLSTNYTVNVTVSPDTSPAVSFTAQEINMTLTENTVENTMIGNISANILQNGIRLRYLIINADVENKFRLNNLTGIITNKERVDREQKDIYEFVVRAENINISSQSDLALVRVKILDVNDNPPVFTAASYFYTISENNPVQTTVNQTTKIVATDADIDVNAIIRFEIFDAGECISKFALKDAGEVSTTSIVLDQTIDYEKHKLCKLTLKAYNPNNPAMSSTVNIDINILDYNDNPPEFLDNTGNVYMVSIPEDTTINTEIPVFGRLQDRDSRENSDIVLSAFNSDCIFDVRNDNNTIKLDLRSNVNLDYESKTTLFTCNIKAQDKGSPVLSATATLNISITDVNDNAPNVMNPSINTNVSRFEDINKIIGQIQATDADSGENRRLTYSLQDSEYSSKFKIDPHTGNISINAPLIFVQTDQITIRVIVSDNGSPRLSAYAIVNVKINDDNARPYFKQQETTSIFEEIPLKDGIITQVQAYDKVNGREVICDCTYRMDTLRNDIIIDNVTGTIKFRNINGSFDRESEWNSRVDVNVIARDKDNPPKDSNVMTVTIYIKDINDNFPVFRQQDYNFSVFQKAPDGTPIGKVTAEDKDEDPKTVYSIQITGDWGSTVSINESTGVITKSGNMSLNQIQNAEIKGYVIAKDNKDPTKPPVPCLITITIEYDDKNNHTPTFEKGQYEFDLTWDTEAGYSITQLIAKDADSGREGVLSYTIVGGDDRGFFRIGPDDGRLTLAFKLDNSIGTANVIKVNLTVRANDHGILPKSSTTTVIITISGQNPGLCVQGAAHQKRVTSLEDERDNWSKALYALVAGLCVAVILMLFFLYKWRTSSPVPSSSPFETNKHKYFSNETAYSDLDRRQTVEYSQSNQAFEPPDPYNKITEERSSSNEPAPDYPTREWETPQTRVLPHSSFT